MKQSCFLEREMLCFVWFCHLLGWLVRMVVKFSVRVRAHSFNESLNEWHSSNHFHFTFTKNQR